MPKKPRKRYHLYTFTVAEAFPITNQLSVDILRLMASVNDMSEVVMWMGANRSLPKRPVTNHKARIRLAIQYRLLGAIMFEALVVVGEMQGSDDFKKAVRHLSKNGQIALAELNKENSKGLESIRSRLSLGRKRVTFHYDRDEFKEALSKFCEIFREKEEAQSKFLYQQNGRAYYLLPEQLRDIAAYGFETREDVAKVPEKLGVIGEVARLQGELYSFLAEIIAAYMKEQNIEGAFRQEILYD